MFTINIKSPKGDSRIEVDGNACEMYCWLDDMPQELLKVSVQDDVLCVDAFYLKLYTSLENSASYEWKLSDMKKKKVSLFADEEIDDPDLKTYLNEDDELDIIKLVKDKTSKGKKLLFSLTENATSKECGDYKISYGMTYDDSRQVIRLEYTSTEPKIYEEGISGSYFNKGITSWIKHFTIDERLSFDFCNTPFVPMMQKIASYCKQEHLEFSVCCEEYNIPGHYIFIPHAVVETDRFMVVFDFSGRIKEVHVAKPIMDTSSYKESGGKTYVIGDIIRKVKDEGIEFGSIRGFGAQNIWHRLYPDDKKYIYGCGFNL